MQITREIDPWVLDIESLRNEARDFPYKNRVSGYGMTTYQNVENGENCGIKLGCSWIDGNPGFFIYIRIKVLDGDGYYGLDLESFEKAHMLIMALKEKGYTFTEYDSCVDCELGIEAETAQSRLNELKILLVEIIGKRRNDFPIRDKYSHDGLEWN